MSPFREKIVSISITVRSPRTGRERCSVALFSLAIHVPLSLHRLITAWNIDQTHVVLITFLRWSVPIGVKDALLRTYKRMRASRVQHRNGRRRDARRRNRFTSRDRIWVPDVAPSPRPRPIERHRCNDVSPHANAFRTLKSAHGWTRVIKHAWKCATLPVRFRMRCSPPVARHAIDNAPNVCAVAAFYRSGGSRYPRTRARLERVHQTCQTRSIKWAEYIEWIRARTNLTVEKKK